MGTVDLSCKKRKSVMNESEQSSVTTAIAEILKDISSVLQSVVETLNSLGVSSPEDFRYVQEADLLPVLRPIQARKLVSAWSQIKESSDSLPSSRESSSGTQSSSCSSSPSSTFGKASTVASDWADNFKIPWEKLPEALMQCLERQKRQTPRLRRDMVKIVSEMMKMCESPSKQNSTVIAKKMVAKYPASLQDVIDGDIVGAGYHSLLKQIQNRVENVKRTNVQKIQKRSRTEDSDTEEIPAERRAAVQDTYGCVNWNVEFMPLNETKESQLEKQEMMKIKSKATNFDSEVSTLLKATYYTQRKDINNGASIQQLCENWPFLFQEVGMCTHFKQLTGIDLKEMFLKSLDKKGQRLLNFLKKVGAEKKPKVMQTAAKLDVLRCQPEGCSEDLKDVVLLLLAYFDEKEEVMFHYVEESCLAEDVDVDKLPATPCIIVCGTSCYTSKLFMLSIDQKISTPHISKFVAAICMMFSSYYCFNIHYPLELGSTLEFIQRCFFSINPEKGTKVESRKNKKQLPVNPRVLTLIADLADHEWRTD
ncbi:hypothetical protein ROHU_001312 [Labeo rohita]|uniref:Uncharacterized protein n=1 Tax=Labeo rohita TaxID=84645 RepID=A0A498P2D8_LABRO|nr:hypothetical protein ROHU_001312 [Labeo rohita]